MMRNGYFVPRHRVGVGVLAIVMLGVLMLGSACSDSEDGAPKLDDPVKTGTDLVTEYAILIQAKDADALDAFISDAFIIQRADGSTSEKDAYLENFPDVGEFSITEVVALQQGNVLVVRWSISVEEVADGTRLTSEPAPRLTTFAYEDGKWRLTSHANFAAPEE